VPPVVGFDELVSPRCGRWEASLSVQRSGAPGREPHHEPPASSIPADSPSDELIGYIVHELLNPLSAISGTVETLERSIDKMDAEMISVSLRSLRRSTKNVTALVESLAAARSIDSEPPELELERVSPSDLLREILGDLDPLLKQHPVILRMDDDPPLDIDKPRVTQIVTNLLSNAAKFSPPNSAIEIHSRQSGEELHIVVVDSGPGIPGEREAELFKKFSRLGSRTKGMGVGLFISRGIARAHGGDLVFEPDHHRGARFVLKLPIRSRSRDAHDIAGGDRGPPVD
jgi:signal transduction histidine kinase